MRYPPGRYEFRVRVVHVEAVHEGVDVRQQRNCGAWAMPSYWAENVCRVGLFAGVAPLNGTPRKLGWGSREAARRLVTNNHDEGDIVRFGEPIATRELISYMIGALR